MFQNFNFLYSFFNQTAVHVSYFQFFIIRAVDIFKFFCRAVAIRAVVNFRIKTCICSKWRFFDFWAVFIFLTSARTVSSSWDFGVEQIFRADEFRADDPSPFIGVEVIVTFVTLLSCFLKDLLPLLLMFKNNFYKVKYISCIKKSKRKTPS